MARKIVITSGKGGVGKTTVTANLGYSLANLGAKVALIDIDFGLNNLDVVMGVENKVVYDILDVFEGRCRVKQALIQDSRRKNLYILPSGSLMPTHNMSGQSVKLIIESISNSFDFVLIDCPAGIDIGFHRAISCADEAFIVVTPNLTSIRDADKVISLVRSYKPNYVGLIVNKARGDLMLGDKMMKPDDIESLLKTELIGVLPEEDEVFLSSGYTLSRSCESHKAYKVLANNVLKHSNKIYDVTEKYSGFFGSIKRAIKRSVWGKRTTK